MKPLKVKTLFLGKVGVHQKYVENAKRNKEDLYLKLNNDLMVIRYDEIDMLGRMSRKTYLDRFSNNFYRLVYFDFRPQQRQKELL